MIMLLIFQLFSRVAQTSKNKSTRQSSRPPHINPGRNPPGVDESQGLERLGQPEVGQDLHLPPQLEPLLSLRAAQQTCHHGRKRRRRKLAVRMMMMKMRMMIDDVMMRNGEIRKTRKKKSMKKSKNNKPVKTVLVRQTK